MQYLGFLGLQGHAYSVVFPLAKRAEHPDDPAAQEVWVTLDQGDGLDNPDLYEVR